MEQEDGMSEARRSREGRLRVKRGEVPRCAYLDAGTATLVFQALIAGALGSLFLLKSFWRRTLDFLNTLLRPSSRPARPDRSGDDPGS